MRLRSKILLSLTTAGVVLGGAVGVVAAQSPSDAPAEPTVRPVMQQRSQRGPLGGLADFLGLTPEVVHEQLKAGATPADVAASVGVEAQALIDYLVAQATARIEDGLAAGRIDAVRAAEILAAMPDRFATLVIGGRSAGRAPGEGETRAQRGEGEQRRGAAGLAVVTKSLGLSTDALVETLRTDGISLADLALQNGSSPEAVIAALIAPTQERIAAALAAGRITTEEAAERLAKATECATERVFAAGPRPPLI